MFRLFRNLITGLDYKLNLFKRFMLGSFSETAVVMFIVGCSLEGGEVPLMRVPCNVLGQLGLPDTSLSRPAGDIQYCLEAILTPNLGIIPSVTIVGALLCVQLMRFEDY